MRGVKRVSLVLVILALVLVTLAFVLENQQGVTLSFLGWSTAQLPVAVFITLALILGMLISPLLGGVIRLAGRRKPNL
ncbi:lipopolysaccharide assembly protein LapA domain-containing protein [Pseudomonas marginalis]|uniref:lipopolysaccharide assembly protein LapA domain-containing protein n=1 Tax=Pseudomonas TaxID=286 RepID=UPI00389A56CC